MKLVALPAFTDNYIWMLHDGRQALVVDPGDAAPVQEALAAQHLVLTGILVTHHHADHVGGVAALMPQLEGPVWGPAGETMPVPVTRMHQGGQACWQGLCFEVLDVPGHTSGHIAYFLAASGAEAPLLFCGDTLFSGGCGRLFEGTPKQMHDSLNRLSALPGNTRVCCAHEYTLSNLRFAQAVEPANPALAAYVEHCQTLRREGQPTLPSTIATEQAINPFLRSEQPAVMASARQHDASVHDPLSAFAALREWKNVFR